MLFLSYATLTRQHNERTLIGRAFVVRRRAYSYSHLRNLVLVQTLRKATGDNITVGQYFISVITENSNRVWMT